MMVVVNRHPVYSALFLVLTFLGLSVFFLQLQAPFIAAVQVIVYAGAIMVLFLFVIMLLGEDKPIPGELKAGKELPLGALFAFCLVMEIGYLMARTMTRGGPRAPGKIQTVGTTDAAGLVDFGSVKAIGDTLFTQYLFAFEATSIVLLVAMIGVVVLAKRRL